MYTIISSFIQGNENLNHLLSQETYELRMEVSDKTDQIRYVKYTHVDVMDESSKYTISISGYSGNVDNMIIYSLSKYRIRIKSGYYDNFGLIIYKNSLS